MIIKSLDHLRLISNRIADNVSEKDCIFLIGEIGVGKNNFPSNYIIENSGNNIADKNFCYSETSFHYWIWKNLLPKLNEDEWIGTCQYRRYFVKKEYANKIQYDNRQQGLYDLNNIEDLKSILQLEPEKEWNNYDVVLCKPWSCLLYTSPSPRD